VAAVLLIGIGVLTLTNRLTVLNSFFPSLSAIQVAGQLSIPPTGVGSPSALVGNQLPAVTVTGLDGHRLDLSSLHGQPAVITFWATWCVPCKEELPMFAAAYRAHRDQGLNLVAINYEESPGAISRFWKDLGLEPPPYLDPDGSVAHRFGVGLQQTGLPVTILVARDGNVQVVLPGEITGADFNVRLNQLLACPWIGLEMRGSHYDLEEFTLSLSYVTASARSAGSASSSGCASTSLIISCEPPTYV